jgi:glutamate-5-semialdehyde dehydrogenase
MMNEIDSLTDSFRAVQLASKKLILISDEKIKAVLISLAEAAISSAELILRENQKDLDRMSTVDPKYDRLQLTNKRLQDIANEIKKVAELPSPVGILLEQKTMDNGIQISKISVPIGVIGVIFEARPNVTFDVFSLCLQSRNACILKGGSDAEFSNLAIVKIIQSVLKQNGLPENCIELLPATREATTQLLNAVGYIDVIIPRGSQQLIDFVRKESKVPVIETGAGIVHAYFDESGDIQKGKAIIYNSKTRRVSVCNALDCLLIHASQLKNLPELVSNLSDKNVLIYADDLAYKALENNYPSNLLMNANEKHFGTEFLDYIMAIKTVASIEAAINHISEYSSKHSETIIAENKQNIEQFLQQVDAEKVFKQKVKC